MAYSFDPAVIQDQLLKILKRSPETQPYAQHRVGQIVAQIMSIPLVRQLQTQVEQLQHIVQQLQADRENADMVYQKKQDKLTKATSKLRQHKISLQKQMEKSKQLQILNQQHLSQIQHLKYNNEKILNQLKQLNEKYIKIQKEQQIKEVYTVQIKQELQQVKNQLRTNVQRIKTLQESNQKLKKINKQIKYNEIKVKKEWSSSQQQLQQLNEELNKYRQLLRAEKSQRQNERKAMIAKINELYIKCKRFHKAQKKLNMLLQSSSELKKQISQLRCKFNDGMGKLSSQFKNVCNSIMDEIGEQVSHELKQLMTQIAKNKTEIRILREQAKIKDDIVYKLEKASSVQLMGNKELQRQLKSKKIEADSLRKQLKRNYQESQIKYLGLEQSYRQILASTINIPNR